MRMGWISTHGVLHQLSNTTCLSKDSITGAHHVFAGNMRTRFVPVQLVQPLLILNTTPHTENGHSSECRIVRDTYASAWVLQRCGGFVN